MWAGAGGWEGVLSGSLCADIAHSKHSAIANFSAVRRGNAERDIKIENFDRYSEVVQSLRKDIKKPELAEHFFWWLLLGCLASQMI